jgi:hypothetical protein
VSSSTRFSALRDRSSARVCGGHCLAAANVGLRAPLLYGAVRRAPTDTNGWRPRSGHGIDRIQGDRFSRFNHREIIFLTFSPLDLHILNLTFNSIIHFFTNQHIWHTASYTIIHNDHNTHFCFKADSCLGPFSFRIISFPLNPCRLSVL